MRDLASTFSDQPRWQRIFEHTNRLADELKISREEFVSRALIEFIEKTENQRLTGELNEAYKNIDQQEANVFLNHLVSNYDPRLADE